MIILRFPFSVKLTGLNLQRGYHDIRLLFVSCLLFVALISPEFAMPQYEHKTFTSNLLVEAKLHYGFFYAHHLELEIFNSHFPAFELNLQKQTYGKHKSERSYDYPLVGFSFFYSGLGGFDAIGSSFALYPFINFPLWRKNDFFLGFRFGLGVGYLTKKFDRIDNYKNLAIGSNLNAAVNIMFDLRYRLSNRFILSGGISLQHFSNGSLKLPNYGLNIPLINLGLVYRLEKSLPF